jgi:hypothetical protein
MTIFKAYDIRGVVPAEEAGYGAADAARLLRAELGGDDPPDVVGLEDGHESGV